MPNSTPLYKPSVALSSRVWAEVNLRNIRSNVRTLITSFGSNTALIAVVKANAYGLGAVEVARAAIEAGASELAVATADEGVSLREAGIAAPILVLGYVPPIMLADAVAADLTLTVNEASTARVIAEKSVWQGKITKVQIKLDTGLHRYGLEPEKAVEMAQLIRSLPGLQLCGLYTHFATGDEADQSYLYKQLARYEAGRRLLAEHGIYFAEHHLSNSAAGMTVPEARAQAVRVGIAMLGYYPSETVEAKSVLDGVELRPALTLKSTVVRVSWASPEECVGYGCTFVTDQPTKLALIPIGYADGYPRALSNRADVLINGQRARVVGRVSMDQSIADVTHLPDIQTGDEVVLIGKQGEQEIRLEEIAALCDTIGYEILTGLGNRVKRVYVE